MVRCVDNKNNDTPERQGTERQGTVLCVTTKEDMRLFHCVRVFK